MSKKPKATPIRRAPVQVVPAKKTKVLTLSVGADEPELPGPIENRWPFSRYEMLDGRAMEAQTLIEDAMHEVAGISRVLNRDTDFAVEARPPAIPGEHSHCYAISLAADANRALAVALAFVAKLGSEMDYMEMVASGRRPLGETEVSHAS
jgi:hypothetical protein